MSLDLKKRIYDIDGYSMDLTINSEELEILRTQVREQYLNVINEHYPHLIDSFKNKGIEFYHELAHLVDHSAIWPKLNRCLPQESCDEIKKMTFFKNLEDVFGPFKLGEVVYEKEVISGKDEMYWRIVRPNRPDDVGTLHADAWFHLAMKIRERCFPEGAHALKVWIPLYVEPGKNGLEIVVGSHKNKEEWDYTVVEIGNTSKPRLRVPEESLVSRKLLETPPGTVLVFNEDLVHVGALNQGEATRVSLEITLLKTSC